MNARIGSIDSVFLVNSLPFEAVRLQNLLFRFRNFFVQQHVSKRKTATQFAGWKKTYRKVGQLYWYSPVRLR